MAKKKGKGSSDADWEKELAKKASKNSAREKSRGGGARNKISIRKRRYTLGEEKFGREMKVVILDFVYLNTHYAGKFSEDKPNIPRCFALSEDGEDMVPHENVKKPINDECDGCPFNEWGSGKGRAKKCQGRRRLAVLHADDIETAEDVAEAEIAMVELPVTSIKHWGKYTKELDNEVHRPVHSVITLMGFDEDESYPVPTFELEEKITDKEVVDALEARIEEARKMLMEPFDATGSDKDDDDEDEDEDDEDEDDDDDDRKSRRSKKSKSSKKSKYRRDKDEDDDDDDDEDDDDEDDDEDDEEDEEEDEDDDEDDEEGDAKRKRSGRGKAKRAGRKSRDADDDDDDDDEDDEDDDEADEDDDEDEDEDDGDEDDKPKKGKRKGSRFSK
jgi:hypothetical protein